jgi:hypothetical protein
MKIVVHSSVLYHYSCVWVQHSASISCTLKMLEVYASETLMTYQTGGCHVHKCTATKCIATGISNSIIQIVYCIS